MSLLFESFAYRRGVPADADFVFDARGLPNPHWDPAPAPAVRPRCRRARVPRRAAGRAASSSTRSAQFLDTWLPRLQSDSTRSYVTIAFGCTGGRHRSVYLAERLAEHAREQGWDEVAVHHRELD